LAASGSAQLIAFQPPQILHVARWTSDTDTGTVGGLWQEIMKNVAVLVGEVVKDM
jgi:hypothetical protein